MNHSEYKNRKRVTIISAGMGGLRTLTADAAERIREADLLIGARRLTEPWTTGEGRLRGSGESGAGPESSGKDKRVFAEHRPEEIRKIVDACGEENICVLVSGDAGFFSGAAGMARALKEYSPVIIPGVSSVAYLSAKTGIPYSGANIISAHGRRVNIVSEVDRHRVTFVLGGGNIRGLLEKLDEFHRDAVRVFVGEDLGTAKEAVTEGTPRELLERDFGTLAVMAVVNEEHAGARRRLRDEEFIRGSVPMTKELVRAAALRRLNLRENAVVYDIGAGTGAVSAEAAGEAWRGTVYAVEYREEALALIAENRLKFGADNLEIVPGRAPEALESLPVPDAVFIGGSEGNLDRILRCVRGKRPAARASEEAGTGSGRESLSAERGGRPGKGDFRIRIVITAVTLQTLQEAAELLRKYAPADSVEEVEITQVSETRLKKAGRYDMFRPETPVFVISGWI